MTMIFWEDHGEDRYWRAMVDGGGCVGHIAFVGVAGVYSGWVEAGRPGAMLKATYSSHSLTDSMLWLGRAYVHLSEAMKELAPGADE